MPSPNPHLRTATRALLLLAIALIQVGCGTAPRIRPIAARPVVVAGQPDTPDAAGYLVEIELENVGDQDIPLERFDYRFEVEGVGSFSGRWAAFLTLPPGTVRRVEIPASMPLASDLADRVDLDAPISWSIDGGLRYQAPGLLGRILFDAGIRRPSEAFSGSGTFQLSRPAQSDPEDSGDAGDEGSEPA